MNKIYTLNGVEFTLKEMNYIVANNEFRPNHPMTIEVIDEMKTLIKDIKAANKSIINLVKGN